MVGETIINIFSSTSGQLPKTRLIYGLDLQSAFSTINIDVDKKNGFRLPLTPEQIAYASDYSAGT